MESLVLVALAAVVALVVRAMIVRRKPQALSPEENECAIELQAFLTRCVEDLRRVIGANGTSVEAKRSEADAILALMEARNVDGQLDAFIQDNREAARDALDRGGAA